MRTVLRPLCAAGVLGFGWAAALGATVSERTREAVRAQLPKFDVAAAEARAAAADTTITDAPPEGVIRLPVFDVRERKIAQPEPDDWFTSGEITRRETRRAEGEMSALELALNRWHIPLLMPSFAQRARGAYEMKKRTEEMNRLTRIERLATGGRP